MASTYKKHYPHLDILKGFAIVCVVIAHIIQFDLYSPLGLDIRESLTFRWISSFHMPLFVLVSGFLSYRTSISSWADVVKHLETKAPQLLLPLLCIPLLYATIFAINPRTILFGLYHGGFWFTWTLFLLFVLFSLGLYLNSLFTPQKHQWLKVLWVLAPFFLIKGLNTPLRSYSGELYSAIGWELLVWLYPYFATGYFVNHYKLLDKRYTPRPITMVIVCFAFYIFYMFSDLIPLAYQYNTDTFSLLVYYPVVMSMLCVLWYGAIKLNSHFPRVSSLLAQLGKISLPIYFVHYFFLTNHYLPVCDWLKENRLPSEIYTLIALLISVEVIGVSVFAIYLIRHFPRIYKICFGRLPKSNK